MPEESSQERGHLQQSLLQTTPSDCCNSANLIFHQKKKKKKKKKKSESLQSTLLCDVLPSKSTRASFSFEQSFSAMPDLVMHSTSQNEQMLNVPSASGRFFVFCTIPAKNKRYQLTINDTSALPSSVVVVS
jgi:hypothetical protein